jgi:hypothetical protein
MANLLLISILIMSAAVPIGFASGKSARLGMKRVTAGVAVYVVVWAVYCIYLFRRLGAGY